MSLTQLPDHLPVPVDDGAVKHLRLQRMPHVSLLATSGEWVNIGELAGLVVYYFYPMTGRPDTPLPENWDEIPGARGCTPQSCGFRDAHTQFPLHNARVCGVSTQSSAYQNEAKARLHLPFELLSDPDLLLKDALKLPTFSAADQELYKRITLIARDGVIEKIFYPVFPPSENAGDVLQWLELYA